MVDRKHIISTLEEIGVLLELSGANPFKVRAFENGARALQSYDGDLKAGFESGELAKLKGVGKGILAEVEGLLTDGKSPGREELAVELPPGLLELVKIPGLGPKRARKLYEELGVESVAELEYACHENRLSALKGFGEKSQTKVLDGILALRRYQGRHLLSDAWHLGEDLLAMVRSFEGVDEAELAGSIRRRRETIKDLDILVKTTQVQLVREQFLAMDGIEDVIAAGDTKVSVRLDAGLAVDLRLVEASAWPFALHYFTGSKAHNTGLRQRAKDRSLRLNEYGLFTDGGEGESLACQSETEIFEALGLAYVEPELREDLGELEAAEKGDLPQLVEPTHIRGALHNHSTWSDGAHSIEEMGRAAAAMGWEYLGLSDHSQSARYAGGLLPDEVLQQHEEIDRVNESLKGLTILKGIESDILPDGSLDYDEDLLEHFDFVVASVHGHFGLEEAKQTARLIAAVTNPFSSVLGHPTGRLLLGREGYQANMEAVLEAAAESGCAVELNANPRRLDLDWRQLRAARRLGVTVSIGPDAHRMEGLQDIRYGVAIARKGWLGADDILNTRDLAGLRSWLAARRG